MKRKHRKPNMTQNLDCAGCGKRLAELNLGSINSFGFEIRLDKNAFSEDLAWAVCACGHETPFNAEFFKAIIGLGPGKPLAE